MKMTMKVKLYLVEKNVPQVEAKQVQRFKNGEEQSHSKRKDVSLSIVKCPP